MKNMNELNDKLFQDVLSLPSHLRTILIDELIKSLNVPIIKEIDELWAKEAENRISEVNSGKIKSISGDKVTKEIQSRFKK